MNELKCARPAPAAIVVGWWREGRMYEIWRHRATDKRYLVLIRDGAALVAMGPLLAGEDPSAALEAAAFRGYDPRALLQMRAASDSYDREYAIGGGGKAIKLTP
jgi:hypothetical protein